MTYDMNTHDTNSAYAIPSTSADRKTVVALEVKDTGDVKLGLVRKDWAGVFCLGWAPEFNQKRVQRVLESNQLKNLLRPLYGGPVTPLLTSASHSAQPIFLYLRCVKFCGGSSGIFFRVETSSSTTPRTIGRSRSHPRLAWLVTTADAISFVMTSTTSGGS